MQQLLLIENPQQLARIPTVAGWPAIDPDVVIRDSPDSHWVFIDDNGQIVGRCSLWWHNTPPYCEHRIGVIGHYAASDSWAAHRVLEHAREELAAHGCTMAVGPMDGNTWRQYRLVTEFGSEPPYFLEPTNPKDGPDHFVQNGFKPLAEYFSALNDDLSIVFEARQPRTVERMRKAQTAVKGCLDSNNPLIQRVADQMNTIGVRLRSLNPKQYEDDLRRIHSVAQVSFKDNLLYAPIDEEEFLDLYRPLQHLADLDLVLIAERNDEPVGFLFAVPDLLQSSRGEPIDTLIVKALAILPGQEYAGLGHLLMNRVQFAARKLGYTRLIHAMVRDVRHLRRMALSSARLIRRYTLFAKELGS